MKRSRVGMIAGLVIVMLITAGCGSGGSGTSQWVAKVNGDEISMADFNKGVETVQKAAEAQGMSFDSDEGKQALEQMKDQVLQGMVGSKIIAQEVKKLKLNVDDPKIKDQIAQIKTHLGGEDQYKKLLEQNNVTEQDLINQIALTQKVSEGITVTDAQVKDYFDQNKDQYQEQVQARHILVGTEAEAKDIIKQLDGGADFATLAKEKSTEPGADQSGGELGYFPRGQMDKAFEDAAFAQEVGTWSKTPVKSQFGYHVILVEDHTKAVPEDSDQVKADALSNAKDQKVQDYVNDLYNKASIQYAKGYEPTQG